MMQLMLDDAVMMQLMLDDAVKSDDGSEKMMQSS